MTDYFITTAKQTQGIALLLPESVLFILMILCHGYSPEEHHLQMPSTSPGTGQIWMLFGVSIFLGFSFIIMIFFS